MADVLSRLARNTADRERLAAERDALIREAHASGRPVTAIAAAAGLSRMQAHRIITATKEDRT